MATRTGWLYRVPPWRAPLRSHHRRHHRDFDLIPAIGMSIVAILLLELWIAEISLWIAVWMLYGEWLALRWLAIGLYRLNPIGRAASAIAEHR